MQRNGQDVSHNSLKGKSIEKIAEEAVPRISVMGIGGAGCNIISWLKRKGISGAKIYALNTDANHLSITKADGKILLGYNICRGLGCGGFPEQGARAAEESAEQIRKTIGDSRLVFITAGLGGGTGTGASPVVARIAKEAGALTLGVVTTPFRVEKARLLKAKEGLKRLTEASDAVIVIDNNRIREIAGNLPLAGAFATANEMIGAFIKNISEIIAVPSLINMDFADLKTIMRRSTVCAMGIGVGEGDKKVKDSVEKALKMPLLDIGSVKRAEGALLHIEGGNDMTLEDVNRAAELVISSIHPNAEVSWGARVNSSMQGIIKTTVVLSGVNSQFLTEKLEPSAIQRKHKKET